MRIFQRCDPLHRLRGDVHRPRRPSYHRRNPLAMSQRTNPAQLRSQASEVNSSNRRKTSQNQSSRVDRRGRCSNQLRSRLLAFGRLGRNRRLRTPSSRHQFPPRLLRLHPGKNRSSHLVDQRSRIAPRTAEMKNPTAMRWTWTISASTNISPSPDRLQSTQRPFRPLNYHRPPSLRKSKLPHLVQHSTSSPPHSTTPALSPLSPRPLHLCRVDSRSRSQRRIFILNFPLSTKPLLPLFRSRRCRMYARWTFTPQLVPSSRRFRRPLDRLPVSTRLRRDRQGRKRTELSTHSPPITRITTSNRSSRRNRNRQHFRNQQSRRRRKRES